MQLAIDHHRVDPGAAVVYGNISEDPGRASLAIDFDDGDVGAERPDEVRRIEEGGGLQAALHPLRETARLEGRDGDLLDGHGFGGRSLDVGFAAFVDDVAFGRLQQMRRDLFGLLLDLHGADVNRVSIERGAPAAIGVHAHRTNRGVAMLHIDVTDRDAENVCRDLGVCRLVTLAVGRAANDHRGFAGEMDVDDRHSPERDPHRGLRRHRRPQATDLDIGGQADAEVLALLALLRLLTPQPLVIDHLQRPVEGDAVVARIVSKTEEGGERLVLDANEILSPDLGRIDPRLLGYQVHDALDQEGRLGPPGAAIGIGWRPIRIDTDSPSVEGLHPIGTLGDQHAKYLECAELAAVGTKVEPLRGPDAEDGPIAHGRNLHVPDLRPSMMRRFRVLAPVFDPFHWPPKSTRGQCGHDLLGVDADLRAEAAAHLRGDDSDITLRDAEDDRGPDLDEVRDLGR